MPTIVATVTNSGGASTSASEIIHVSSPFTSELSIDLALPSGTLTFSQAAATQLGDYVGVFVHQRCFVQRQGPWTVFFRPDVNDVRQEVVVEYGTQFDFSNVTSVIVPRTTPLITTFDGGVPAHITSPYTATIKRGTDVLATIVVPRHWYSSRWRWQSSSRPIVRNYDDLIAMKAILPFDINEKFTAQASTSAITWSGPMGTGGLTTYMPTTGDRREIGYITEHQAEYLMTGNPLALTSLLSQAEAMGTIPIWFRDKDTLSPLDVHLHPYVASWTDSFQNAYSRSIPQPPHVSNPDPTYFTPGPAHFPALSFVPWLLTDDPFFLEGLQMSSIEYIIYSNGNQSTEKLPGLIGLSQLRSWAWGLRDVMELAKFSPVAPPAWLLPRSKFAACGQDTLNWAKKTIATSVLPIVRDFNFIVASTGIMWSSFELDFMTIVFAWIRWNGDFPEWNDVIDFGIVPRMKWAADPADGAGWDRRYPAPYDDNYKFTTPIPSDWASFWVWYKGVAHINDSTWISNSLSPTANLGYCQEALGVLAALSQIDIPKAKEAHDWLRGQLLLRVGNWASLKWALRAKT